MTAAPVEGRLVVPNSTARLCGVVFVVCGVPMVAVGLAQTVANPGLVYVVVAVLGVALVVLSVRWIRSGVTISDSGFVLRGEMFPTRSLLWSDVREVSTRGFIAGVTLQDGRRLPLYILQRVPAERDPVYRALTEHMPPKTTRDSKPDDLETPQI